MDEQLRRELRHIVYELMTECLSIEQTEPATDRLMKFSVFLRKIIREYFAEQERDWDNLVPFLNLQKEFLGHSANKVYRAERFCKQIVAGKSVADDKVRQAAADFRRAVRKHIHRMGEWCDVKVDFDTTSLIGISDDQPVQGNVEPAKVSPPRFDSSTPRFNTDNSDDRPASRPVSGPAQRVERTQRPSLEATSKDPDLTASTVAEYAFCPRAGVVTHESEYSARDEELPSLAGLHWFERAAIDEAYDRSSKKLFGLLVGCIATLFILVMLPLERMPFLALVLCSVGAGSYFIALEYLEWLVLRGRRLEAQLARPCMPDPHSTARQSVDWWGLLLAEFDVLRLQSAMTDRLWKLSGKPHRILKHGDITVPVHRTRSSDGIVHSQHVVRAMIHCHLIEATEGATCPYAIILFGDTYKGTTIPNTRENREQFYTVLERARAMIIDTTAGDREPPEPTDASTRCHGCFHGQPRPATNKDKTTRHGEVVDPYFFTNGKGRIFHCTCGDRFKWIPKHRRAKFMKKR